MLPLLPKATAALSSPPPGRADTVAALGGIDSGTPGVPLPGTATSDIDPLARNPPLAPGAERSCGAWCVAGYLGGLALAIAVMCMVGTSWRRLCEYVCSTAVVVADDADDADELEPREVELESIGAEQEREREREQDRLRPR